MPATPILLALGPASSFRATLPECLQPVAGDPCLLWVLRAWPGTAPLPLIVHAHEAVAAAVSQWHREGWIPALPECLQAADRVAAAAILEQRGLYAVAAVPGNAPLLDAETLTQLLAQTMSPADLTDWSADALCTCLNSRADQAELETLARLQLTALWMDQGISIPDPDAVTLGPRVVLNPDVVLESGVRLEGSVVVGRGSHIGQGCVIRDTTIGQDVLFRPYCVATQAHVGDGARIGPFAHLREGSVLHEDVHMGNFVETKKTILHRGAKANHLSYLGDADIGERTNIGAGCITCNYDGYLKHRTVIGKDVFVGSDCQLVAPLTLEDGSLIAAGTTVTQSVPADALALSRVPQVNKPDAARRLRERLAAQKALK